MIRSKLPLSLVVLLAAALTAAGDGAPGQTQPPRDYTLRLAEFAFDPLQRQPAVPSGWDRSSSSRPDLHLVQLEGPTEKSTLEAIEAGGLRIVQYIHPYTYIVWGRTSDRLQVSGDPGVRWTGDFAPAFRVQPAFRALEGASARIKVTIFGGAGADAVVQEISALGARFLGRRPVGGKFEIAVFQVAGDQILAVAAVPGVYTVRPQPTDGGVRSEMSNQVNVNNVDSGNLAFPGYQAYLSGLGLDGTGVIMANVDSGVDELHPDLVNRMLPCSGTTCSTTSSGHGTHTAGIMVADGASNTLDGSGFLRGLGVAPGAQIFEQNYSPTFTQPGGLLTLIQDSHANGAFFSSNSWGPSGSPQGYDDDTMQVDIGVRDADPGTPGNQQFTYVLSFMNGYGGTNSQGSPDEAKNILTIGSTKLQFSSGTQDTQIDDLSSNSAHGPALDGRTIPHMVAPGCSVDSTEPGGFYGLRCGTSMASPHVSGGVALFYQYYRGLPDHSGDPSPALVKAVFLATARSLSGNQDADGVNLGHPFDSKQGWGRMDLEAVIDPPPGSVQYFDEPLIFDSTGEEWSQTLAPLDPAKPVRIMLVWTDAPGHGLGGSTPAWNNDLDLVVDADGQTYLGNRFGTNGYSISGGAADSMNNTEGVFLDPAPSEMTLRVLATNINSDGVPAVGDSTDQDFAVACYNCAPASSFSLSTPGSIATTCAPNPASYTIDVGSIQGFADPVTLTLAGQPAGTSVRIQPNPVTPSGTAVVEIDNTGGASAGSYPLSLAGDSGTLVRQLDLTLELYGGPPEAAEDLHVAAVGASNLTWSPPASAGSAPLTYDVLRSSSPADFSTADCIATDSTGQTASDPDLPSPGSGLYYLVRSRTVCGDSLGASSAGVPRVGTGCP